jgi:hypothetical protein
MRPQALFGLIAAPLAVFSALSVFAQDKSTAIQPGQPETAQLSAITVDMNGGPDSYVYDTIWKDVFAQELALREAISKKTGRPAISTTDVFKATFGLPDATIVLSATATPQVDCSSYTNVGLPPSLMTCPMRVALVHGKDVNVIYSSNSFPFAISVNESGSFDPNDSNNKTLVIFDPTSKTIRTQLFQNGSHIEEFKPDSDDTTITLKY